MEYYDKYFNKYKEIMEPVYGWKKQLGILEKVKLSILEISVVLAYMAEIGSSLYIIGKFEMQNIAMIAVVTFILTMTIMVIVKWDKKVQGIINTYKSKVAEKMQVASFNQLIEKRREEYIRDLKQQGITQREQYRILNSWIDKELERHKPKKLINYGIIGAVILPIWNEIIQRLFEEVDMVNAIKIGMVCIVMLMGLILILEKAEIVKDDILRLVDCDFNRLQEMKCIILELELLATGQGEQD